MDELVEWLRARFNEDERLARAAGSLSGIIAAGSDQWRVSGSHTDDGGTYWSITSTSPDLGRVPVVEMVGSGMSGGGAHTEEVAAHIAEWDPARVLREIDAKRDLLRFAKGIHDHHETFTTGVAARLEQTLRLFALAYADRPGYREEWAP